MAEGDNRTATAREHEAFLDLLMHLCETLAMDWDKQAQESIKRRINEAMRRSLQIWI